MHPTLKFISGIFLITGFALIAFGLNTVKNNNTFINGSKIIPGTVVKIISKNSRNSDGSTSRSYYPVIKYSLDGYVSHEFQSSVGSSPAPYSVNDSVEVYYNQTESKARLKSFLSIWMLPLILFFLGSVFSLIGIAVIFSPLKKRMIIKKLKHQGVLIYAKVKEVRTNSSFKVNGQSPKNVVCIGEYRGRSMEFKSVNIWDNRLKDLNVGDQINVKINPKKTSEYYVDLSAFDRKPKRKRHA